MLAVLFLVALVYVVSLTTKSENVLSNTAVRPVTRSVPIHKIFCSPNSSDVQTLMNRTLAYLEGLQPDVVSFHRSAADAEQAYLGVVGSAHAANARVVGVDFAELAIPSTVRYSLRFRSHDVADTKKFFNHARECL